MSLAPLTPLPDPPPTPDSGVGGATPRRITFRLEGGRADEGLVRAPEFVAFLEKALSILRRFERGQTGELRKTEAVYRVVDLEIGSAVVELEADAPDALDVAAVYDRFTEGVAAFRDGRFDALGYDAATAEAFAEMMAPLKRGLQAIRVAANGTEVAVEADRVETFDLAPNVEAELVGAVSGYVDVINVHREPVFFLYPTTGGPRVRCRFDRGLLDEVRGALKRYSTVYGLVGYVAGNPLPAYLIVERVEVHPPVQELPTLASLWGAAPGLTGGVDSVTFVRRLRDAEE